MNPIDSLERFLEIQSAACRCRGEDWKSRPPGPVIAITREPGCDGEAIAQALAQKLGLVLYDWEIVEQIAKDAHVSEQVVATLNEKLRSELEEWMLDMTGGSSLSAHLYLQCLKKVLFTIAAHGHAVILGRGANFLLPPAKTTLGLCLVAPLAARVRHIMQTQHMSQEDAQAHIVKSERTQRLWVRKYGQADLTDATCYHLVINTARVSVDTLAQIVTALLPKATILAECNDRNPTEQTQKKEHE